MSFLNRARRRAALLVVALLLITAATLPAQTLRNRTLDSLLARVDTVTVVESKVEDASSGGVVKLLNGAIFEVSTGYVSYIGYGRKTLLICRGQSSCQLWVEGKRLYRGMLLRGPQYGRGEPGVVAYLADVRGRGSILRLASGAMYEVDDYQTYTTSLWMPAQQVVVMGGGFRIINLDDTMGGEVSVQPLR